MEIWMTIMIFVLGLCFGSFVNMLVYRTAVKYELIKSSRAKSRDLTKKKKKDFSTSVEMTKGTVEMTKGTVEMTKGTVEMMKKRFFHFGRNDKFFYINENRSFCDYCGKELKWFENIPVISWLIQKGKSRCCQKKLSILYPIVELSTGFLLVLIINHFGVFSSYFPLGIKLMQLFWLVLVLTLLVFLVVFDVKYLILPDFAVISLIVISFFGVIIDEPNIIPYLLSAAGAFVFLEFLYLITKGKGIGFGDVKLAIFMGLFLGYPKIIVAMYLAFIIGAVFGLGGILIKKMNKKSRIAFGPFLILGTFVSWFWGDQIIKFLISNPPIGRAGF